LRLAGTNKKETKLPNSSQLIGQSS